MRIRALLGAALMSVGVVSSAQAAEPSSDALIVERAPGLGAAELRERAGLEPAGRVPGLDRVDVVEPADGDRDAALAAMRADPEVRWAEPVLERRALADSRFGDEWGLHNTGQWIDGFKGIVGADIDALAAWDVTQGAGVTIAVVDSGAALAHPDLVSQLIGNPGERGQGRETNGIDDDRNGLTDDWRGWDFVADDNRPEDADLKGHGTHVAGIAAAAVGGGEVIGVAPDADLLVLQALGANASGTSADTAAAFAYAGRLGVRVVNASFGADTWSDAERAAIRAYPNTLFVVGAGNEARSASSTYPCAYEEPNVLCVGASTNRDTVALFSNFGTSVDLFAPGDGIVSTAPPAGYATKDGTSMATPHVAGTAALVASEHPNWTPARIKDALIATVDRRSAFTGKALSGGRLDAADALGWVAPSGANDAAPPPGPAWAAVTPPGWSPPSPSPAPSPSRDSTPAAGAQAVPAGPAGGAPARRATVPVVSRLRVVGRPGRRSAALSFTASAAGQVRLIVERRAGRRYKRVGTGTLAVAAGSQRTRLGTRIAGVRLKRGTWRVSLAAARVTFRVR
jgi:thermitase